jgi:hypothetical protein
MWGLVGPYLFGVLITIVISVAVTIQHIADAWAKAAVAREETKRVTAEAAARRAEADARAVATWTPPLPPVVSPPPPSPPTVSTSPDKVTWGMIKDVHIV